MASFKTINLLVSISISFLSLSVLSATVEKIILPSPGPETIAFDNLGRGPYTGVSDGRVLVYNNSTKAFEFFAFTAPNRPEACNGKVTPFLALSTCGRPSGIAFYVVTNQLYIADAFHGLFVVGQSGGQATLLANSADGTNFRLTDGLDVDQTTGDVYFTDASSTGGINEILLLLVIRDSTGRLLKYNPKTNQVTVLLSGLGGPAGVAVSQDGTYLLFTEAVTKRVQKYWIKGPKANTSEIILNFTGLPDGVKRTSSGDYWVTVTEIPFLQLVGYRINEFGNILERLTFSPQLVSILISDIQEYEDKLVLGSFDSSYVEVYRR